MGFGNTCENSGVKNRWGATALAAVMLLGATAAVAADRRVIAECFTSPTCSHCPYAGRALNRMLTSYPDTFTSVQLHTSGSAYFAWVSTRWSYYYVSGDGTPLTWFDGMVKCLGSYDNDNQMFSWYKGVYDQRIVVATDTSIEMTGIETGTNTYEIGLKITRDPGGTSRNLICHVLQIRDYYPASSDNRYRNCARQHTQQSFTLDADDSYEYTTSFTLSTGDAADIDNVKIIAWVQSASTKEIYNSAVMNYPFNSPEIVGDVNGDGDVDLSDLASLLAVYGLCDGDPGYDDKADFEDNDCIDIADLAALLSNYGYGA